MKTQSKIFDPANKHPTAVKAYQIFKKIVKYTLFIIVAYFAYEGFMAWE